MNQENHQLLNITRRQLFGRCAMGLGSIALASLMNDSLLAEPARDIAHPLAPRAPHFKAKAKNVIYLFMAGGPSQLELFDYKPKLVELNGQPIPESFIKGKRAAQAARRPPQVRATRPGRNLGERGASTHRRHCR